jgi:putative DNA primase/helicase
MTAAPFLPRQSIHAELWCRNQSIIPVGLDKKPLVESWKPYQERQATEEEFNAWEERKPPAWAVITGKLSRVIVLDYDGQKGIETMRKLELKPHVQTGSGGYHVYVQHPGWRVPTLNAKTKVELNRQFPGMDIRGDGGYAVFEGRNESGEYRCLRALDDCYHWTEIDSSLLSFLGKPDQEAQEAPRQAAPTAGRVDAERLVGRALDRAGAEGRNNAGFGLALQLRDNGYFQPEAMSIMATYVGRVGSTNTKGQKEAYTMAEAGASVRKAYESPAREPWGPRVTSHAHDHRAGCGSSARPDVPPAAAHATEEQVPNLLAAIHRDHGNAERLIAMYGADLRYCHAFKKWLWFDGQRWRVDECLHARDFAKLTAVEFLRQAVAAGNEVAQKFAKESLDSKRISNMLLEAQSALSISAVDLDTHPYLLNVTNGTVDVRDGRLYPHDRRQFITKMVKYAYRPAATCPTFLRFLERIMGVTPDASEGLLQRAERLIAYLQKAIGYSLTGTTCEKAVFLLYGAGDNGKSTLLALFLELLEEYAVLLQIDSLMVRQESNNTQADLADLRGARFVMTSETEEGQRLAEGKLKRITQGMGRIKATRKYENPVEFPESHKLWIDANHLPVVKGTDNAIWNRLHPIPFTVTIPKAEQDRNLRNKLLAEAEGILAWAVAGAVRWHQEGLGKPPEVEQAGTAWRMESDQMGRFLEACCIVGEFASVAARALYQTYRTWAEEVGERAQPDNIFSKRLAEQGLKSRHTRRGNVYDGIGLLAEGEGGEGR